jgi:hypothetical protein
MDRLRLVGVCVFACVIAGGGAAAAPRELQLASRTMTAAFDDDLSSGGGDYSPLASFGDRGAAPARALGYDELLETPTVLASPADEVKGARKKKLKHKGCIHGGWTSTVEYNPFTLSCAVVGF